MISSLQQQTINKLQNCEIQEIQANQQLSEFFSDQNREHEQQIIISDFETQNVKTLRFMEENFKNKFQHILIKQIVDLEQQIIDKNSVLFQQLQWYDLQYQSSYFDKDIRFKFDLISNTKQTLDYWSFYSTTFSRHQKIRFSFKVLEDNKPTLPLIFGIYPELDNKKYTSGWDQIGNQLCTIKNNNGCFQNKGDFDLKGKFPHEIYKLGIQYDAEIFFNENQIIINDSEKKTQLINKKYLGESEKWVLIFFSSYARKIQIINAEIK